jgi:hypothetical protein
MVVVGFGLNTATLPRGLTNRHLYFNDSGDTSGGRGAWCFVLGASFSTILNEKRKTNTRSG